MNIKLLIVYRRFKKQKKKWKEIHFTIWKFDKNIELDIGVFKSLWV